MLCRVSLRKRRPEGFSRLRPTDAKTHREGQRSGGPDLSDHSREKASCGKRKLPNQTSINGLCMIRIYPAVTQPISSTHSYAVSSVPLLVASAVSSVLGKAGSVSQRVNLENEKRPDLRPASSNSASDSLGTSIAHTSWSPTQEASARSRRPEPSRGR